MQPRVSSSSCCWQHAQAHIQLAPHTCCVCITAFLSYAYIVQAGHAAQGEQLLFVAACTSAHGACPTSLLCMSHAEAHVLCDKVEVRAVRIDAACVHSRVEAQFCTLARGSSVAALRAAPLASSFSMVLLSVAYPTVANSHLCYLRCNKPPLSPGPPQ
jgi:hypothetical protein